MRSAASFPPSELRLCHRNVKPDKDAMVSLLHAPYVRSFSGFGRPWQQLEQLVEDVQVRELAFGSGYVMTGRTPA